MVADAGGHRAERFAFVVPVCVDDTDRQLGAHLDHEAPHAQNLFGPQRQLRVRIGADHAIGVEPRVVDTHFDQAPQPALGR